MKRYLKNRATARRLLPALALAAGLASPLPSLAASVALATSPLATSTTSTVKPNLMFVLDNSLSMQWDHMPDDDGDPGSAVTFNFGYYGLRSSQCNQVYYDPNTVYYPPVDADGISYADSSFSSAEPNGFNTSGTNVDLRSNFKAVGESTGQAAYYYNYSGAQDTQLEKNYHSTTNTFYSECGSAENSSTGLNVFTKVSLSATASATTATIVVSGSNSTSVSGIKVNGTQEIMSGTTTASATSGTVATNIRDQINLCTSAQAGNCTTAGGHGYTASVSSGSSTITITGLAATASTLTVTRGNSGTMTFASTIFPAADTTRLTNFANWYSFYRYRMLMMKTAAGRAFSSLNNSYRVGLMKISSSSAPVVAMDTFEGAHRASWYSELYGMAESGSTPLRTALANAGRYYAGKLSGTDPVQYSCQQNFTILSTDGYWNEGSGFQVDGSTAVGNQDGTLSRPYYDGATIGWSRSTSQIQQSQSRITRSTSQLQKRTEQIQSRTSNLQSSTSSLQSSTWPLLISTSSLQSSTWNLQSSTSNLQSSAWQLQSSTSDLQTSAWQLESSTSDLQTSAWQLESSISNLQSSTMYLQKRTKASSGAAWTGYSNTASCTWKSSGAYPYTQCRYVTVSGGSIVWSAGVATWTNAPVSCTTSFGTVTTNGTVWNNNGTSCRYSAYSAPAPAGSCTIAAQDTTSPYTVPTATTCSYNTTPTVTTGAACTTSAKSTSTANGAVWNNAAKTCAYSAYSAPAPAGSCTMVAKDTTSPYTVLTATTCSYNAAPTITTGAACTTSAKTTSTADGTVWNNAAKTCAYSAYSTPAATGSCTIVAPSAASPYTVVTATTCSYGATPTVTTVTSCTAVAKTTSTANGTVWDPAANTCAYTAYSSAALAASCTYQGQSAGSPYVGPAVTCSYGATPTVATVTSCTPVAKTTSTADGTVWDPAAKTCGYTAYSAATPTASCTYQGQSGSAPYSGPAVTCSYGATPSVATVTSCTPASKTTSTVNGTIWEPAAGTCAYTAYTAPANVSSCTDQAQSASAPYIGPATNCAYTAYSAWADASSCTPALPSGGSPYTIGIATECQTIDTGWGAAGVIIQRRDATGCTPCSWGGWYDDSAACYPEDTGGSSRHQCREVSGCTPSSSGGQTVSCQTITTGPTPVDSCTDASADSTNNYTATTCNSTIVSAATPVASCTFEPASASNNYVTTNCNTVTTGPTVGSCTPATASLANNWTATTCTPTVTAGGTSDNLADIAMYYYQTDLRTQDLGNCGTAVAPATVGPLCENNVFVGGNDNNLQQHMTTFTLGLGASGWMNYSSSYLTDTTGDYVSVKEGSTASSTASPPVCSWQTNGTACGWPAPGLTGSNPGEGWIANIDDLWHAAVNGRGAYFSATNPASLSSGLSNALAGINARKGSAAAAATSTLNPVAGNNYAYVASYTTVSWKGNLEARGINTDTGVVSENATWCVENVVAGTCAAPGAIVAESSGSTTIYNCVTPNSVTCADGVLVGTDCKVPVATACTGTMNARVSAASDLRTIKTANSDGTALVDFAHANLTATQQGYFAAAHIGTLSQWAALSAAQKTAAEGAGLVNYLRGQYGYEDRSANPVGDRLYRYREAVLGDALESQPAFIGPPVFNYPYPGYSAYKTAQTARDGTVYMGANDGMMHAFAADTGVERWAYVPSMVISNMWKLADTGYATSHLNFVNGSPITSDVCTANCSDSGSAVWKTILVGGLNGGGRGYYALDITDPVAPALLWEFTPTTGIGAVQDDDLGYSFGQAIITQKEDGTWVVLVTSGYNNTSPGNGKGYLYVLDAGAGTIISKIATGVGDTTTPSGLAKIAGWNNEFAGNKVGYVYGGDLLGNVWRFDVNSTVSATVAAGEIGTGDVMKFAELYSDAGGTSPQPITTTPVLGKIADKRVVFVGTGKYLETGDLTTTQTHTQYAIKDDDASTTLVNPRNTLVQQTLTVDPGTATRLGSGNTVDFYSGRGWYVDFPDSKERVNIDSKLVQGTLLVPTVVPSNTVCSPGGYGWLNFLDYKTGGAVNTDTDLASVKYDATIVGVNVLYVQGVPKVGVVTSTNPTPELNENVSFAATAAGFSGKRVIWRELMQ